MKKCIILALLLFAVISFAACGGGGNDNAGGGTGGGNAPASGDPFVITIAHTAGEDSFFSALTDAFTAYVDDNADGRIIVNTFPAGQLGGDRDLIEAVQAGDVTITMQSIGPQVSFVPGAVIFDYPFAYPTMEDFLRVVNDETFLELARAEYASAGFRLLGVGYNGHRALTSNFPVHTPADVAGMNLRTMETTYHMAMWSGIGANPTPVPFTELYVALQQGLVDGQENPIDLIFANRLYEQQTHIIHTRHLPHANGLIMNLEFYNSLPDDLRAIVDAAAAAGLQAGLDFIINIIPIREAYFEDEHGITIIYLTPQQIEAFSEMAHEAREMVRNDTPAELLEAFYQARGF